MKMEKMNKQKKSLPIMDSGSASSNNEKAELARMCLPPRCDIAAGSELLRVRRLSKTFVTGRANDGSPILVRALREVSFEIGRGEFIAVVGESGSGKSTLIHCLGSFESPSTGEIEFRAADGQWMGIWSDPVWYRQNVIGIVFQSFHLLPNLKVWQNVALPLQLKRCEEHTSSRFDRREKAVRSLSMLGIEDKAEATVGQLSGGQLQRAAIARAMVKKPRLLLADEPTGNLDQENKEKIIRELKRLTDSGISVLMVTHDVGHIQGVADRIIELRDGEIVNDQRLRSPRFSRVRVEEQEELIAPNIPGAFQTVGVVGGEIGGSDIAAFSPVLKSSSGTEEPEISAESQDPSSLGIEEVQTRETDEICDADEALVADRKASKWPVAESVQSQAESFELPPGVESPPSRDPIDAPPADATASCSGTGGSDVGITGLGDGSQDSRTVAGDSPPMTHMASDVAQENRAVEPGFAGGVVEEGGEAQRTPHQAPAFDADREEDLAMAIPQRRPGAASQPLIQLGGPASSSAVRTGSIPLSAQPQRNWTSAKPTPTKRQQPLFSQTVGDLLLFASADAARNKVSLFSNVAAILFGTVLTAILVALLIGVNSYISALLPRIPEIDTVKVAVDPSTGATPITEQEVAQLRALPGSVAAIPNIQQLGFVSIRKEREPLVSLASSVEHDPALKNLKLLSGKASLAEDSWELVVPESVAEEIDNFNPLGLVGKTVLVTLRRYKDVESTEVTKELSVSAKIVGIVKDTPKNICYGSLNMLRVLRDFGTGRGDYQTAPGENVDLSRISPRTLFEGVRVHFERPSLAEAAYESMRRNKANRFQLYWPGSEVAFLRDGQLIAAIVMIGIGILATVAGSISIFNTLAASVARKTKDFGILRATGFGASDIFMIVMWQAILMGGIAGILGLTFAWTLIAMLNEGIGNKWPELIESLSDTGLSGLFLLPPHIALLLFLAVLLICVASGLLPSWQASRRTPMDALRDAT